MICNRAASVATALLLIALLVALGLVAVRLLRNLDHGADNDVDAALSPAIPRSPAISAEAHQGFLYGRVSTSDGTVLEGRLRFGGNEEAFWGDYFNGFKAQNPWAAQAPSEKLTQSRPVTVLGVELARRERRLDLGRPFMARFGDIRRVEPRGRELLVTLKSGTGFVLDRFDADDFADGVRVWDRRHGVVDLGERRIRALEFLPTADLEAAPPRLHGTVRTAGGSFTGFIAWNRRASAGDDQLRGRTVDGEVDLRFGEIRAIARNGGDGAIVTLRDGRELVLSGTRDVGRGHRGVYVDDPRYGRVLVSWEAFERLDLAPAGSGPAYDDFPAGKPLAGSVTTRDGRRLSGRLVFDLDESETTETLDAPADGVDYTIPFGLVAQVARPGRAAPGDDRRGDQQRGDQQRSDEGRARVTLHGGETLELERAGDLGESNAGVLIFQASGERAEYVTWAEIERIEFDRPAASS